MFDELRGIQHEFGYLPADQLRRLAARIDVPLSQIHAVASFYPHFQLTPPPQVDVRVCADMSCHLRGGVEVKAALEQAFRGTSPEAVSIRDVSCLGRCDQAPAISINDRIYCNVQGERTAAVVKDVLSGGALPEPARDRRRTPVISDPYKGSSNYSVVRKFVETRDWTGIVATLKASGLRGMGGAGFPTGSKWEIVRNAPGKEKYIVCNADESEPGTIKDRFIMENAPWLVIEGMITAGLVTGARRGILYIRHEYENPKEILQEEIERCYREGLLGAGILGSDLSFRSGNLRQPGRLHLRRGERVARSHRRQARRASQQASLPGNEWFVEPAHRDQQRGDVRFCHRDSGARSGLVQVAGQERIGRDEVCRHQRRCEPARNF